VPEEHKTPALPDKRIETRRLLRRLKLRHCPRERLNISREANGEGWIYRGADGVEIKDEAVLKRFASLAVPPAYRDVRFASDERAHLQAVGRDAAGRLQYRYHPEWEHVREAAKAQRLAALVEVLPRIRRAVTQALGAPAANRAFALASVIELVSGSAIRPGSEEYAKKHGTRGAATLLKSNVSINGEMIGLVFRGKSGKDVRKEFSSPRLAAAIARLKTLPGRRLFQYRDEEGQLRLVTTREANAYLREIAGCEITLKDFRTLCASASVLDQLARTVPAASARQRKKQVLEAVRAAADELVNTPAVCRRSYVHDAVITAFEDGVLERFSETLKSCRSPSRREQFLAQVVATASV
jgi:DNA topoisomerase-1